MVSNGISLFDYCSYRSYLNDLYLLEKNQGRATSLKSFSKHFGLSTPLFQMILSGSRNLTINGIHRVVTALRMNDAESEYFEALVLHEQAKSDSERRFYERRLETKSSTSKVKRVRTVDRTLISRWYIPALFVYLVDIAKATDSVLSSRERKNIANRFGIDLDELDQVMHSLEKAGFLKYSSQNGIHFVFDKVSSMMSDKKYLQEVHAESAKRIQTHYGKPGNHFFAHTFSLPQSALPDVLKDYQKLMESYMALPGSENDGVVVQTGFQLFTCEFSKL